MEVNDLSLGLLLWQIFIFLIFVFIGFLAFGLFKKLK